ncbi:MAG: hypothetical protein KJ804_20610 [Proteobacteria bacterium]|nr:hypothetical protein [Pseudomonadota bacterium]MBU1060711.1 hypothetical protein [Pseudomonadota bacterium]
MKDQPGSNNYFICTVQRSGKSWLCNILSRLQHYGVPEEYLKLSVLKKRFGEGDSLKKALAGGDFSGIYDFVEELTIEKSGLSVPLGLAVQSSQMKNIADLTGFSPVDVFKNLYKAFGYPVIFMLKREDLAAQAVSHYFMAQTGIAHSYQADSNKAKTYDNIEYNQKEILKWYDFTCHGYEFWETLFEKCGVVPNYVLYENLRTDLYDNIVTMTRLINRSSQVTPVQVSSASQQSMQKLSISKKALFTAEFKRYFQD